MVLVHRCTRYAFCTSLTVANRFVSRVPRTICDLFLSPSPSPDVTQIRGLKAGSSPSSPLRRMPLLLSARRLEPFLPSSTRTEFVNMFAMVFTFFRVLVRCCFCSGVGDKRGVQQLFSAAILGTTRHPFPARTRPSGEGGTCTCRNAYFFFFFRWAGSVVVGSSTC